MDEARDPHGIETLEQLDTLFGAPGEASIRKEISFVHPPLRRGGPFGDAAAAIAGHVVAALDTGPVPSKPGAGGLQGTQGLAVEGQFG